jgi:predicted DNA-binding protein
MTVENAMSTTTQVSAYISEETKAEVEAYVKRRGVKKGYLIEEALQHHLQALREIPEDLIIPSRLVLAEKAMAQIAKRITQQEQPTEALKALFRD